MAEVAWIKINTDMFDNKKIKQIRKMPGGNDMVLFWVMLLTLAGRSNSQGYILLTEALPYNAEMLANEFDLELNTVKMALEVFSKFNMITIKEEAILITGWTDHQNAEGLEKIKERERAKLRKRKQREKEKLLLSAAKDEICSFKSDEHDMSCDSHCDNMRDVPVTPSYIRDREIDKEIDIEIEDRKIDRRKDLNKINQAYFDTFYRQLSGNYLQSILDILDKGDYTSLILYALEKTKKRAEEQKKEKGFNYTLAILESWINKGFKTVNDVQSSEEKKATGPEGSPMYGPFEFD